MGDRTRDDVATPDTASPFTRSERILRGDRGDGRRRTREGEGIHGSRRDLNDEPERKREREA